MRAALFSHHGGPEVVELGQVETPGYGPHDVRLRVEAVGLNHLDLWVRRGLPGLELPLPHVGGSDVAGTIEALGDEVTGWSEGDAVIVNPVLACHACSYCLAGEHSLCRQFKILGEHVWGGLAEYVVVPSVNLRRRPTRLSAQLAAAVPLAYQTAWRALISRARLRPGETVLILGASGGVATAAIQIAKLAGTVVLAVTSSTEKVKKALELGADVAFDRLSEDWSREVWLRTAKRGVDVVVENVGAATWRDSLRSLAAGGRIVTYGATAGYQAETDLRHVYYRQLTILGSTMASFAEFGQVMDLVDGGRLDPVVSHSLSLDDIRRGHEILEAGQQFGKVVITL